MKLKSIRRKIKKVGKALKSLLTCGVSTEREKEQPPPVVDDVLLPPSPPLTSVSSQVDTMQHPKKFKFKFRAKKPSVPRKQQSFLPMVLSSIEYLHCLLPYPKQSQKQQQQLLPWYNYRGKPSIY